MKTLNFDNKTMEFIAEKNKNNRIEQCTPEQADKYDLRQKIIYFESQRPKQNFVLNVQGMRKVAVYQEATVETFKEQMKKVWGIMYKQYPKDKFRHQLIINEHNDHTEIKFLIMPMVNEEWLQYENDIISGKYDFDSTDKEMDIISNCESFYFTSEDVTGIKVDESRNEEEDYTETVGSELELMNKMEMTFIPEETDGIFRQLIDLRDDLIAETETKARNLKFK